MPIIRTLLAVNALVFFVELSQPSVGELRSFVQTWGVVPLSFEDGPVALRAPVPAGVTLFTSMFLHGGWAHLGGNMLCLWLFGSALEKRLGPYRFLGFYGLCGWVAGAAHVLGNPHSGMPTVGASGAICGIVGGYVVLLLADRPAILTGLDLTRIAGATLLGLSGTVRLLSGALATPGSGDVASLAHMGGSVAGLLCVSWFAAGRYAARRSGARILESVGQERAEAGEGAPGAAWSTQRDSLASGCSLTLAARV